MKPTFYWHGKKTTEKHIGELIGCEIRDWCLREAYSLFILYRITQTNWVTHDGTTWSIEFPA